MNRSAGLLFALCVVLCLTTAARAADEMALFNGRDLSGWTYYLRAPGAKMEDTWSVRDGVLRCEGQPIGYIKTEKGDFVDEILKDVARSRYDLLVLGAYGHNAPKHLKLLSDEALNLVRLTNRPVLVFREGDSLSNGRPDPGPRQ